MTSSLDRRDILALAGLGGVGLVFGSALRGSSLIAPAAAQESPPAASPADDFFFVQLADTHWGFKDDTINPDGRNTLKRVIAGINALSRQPDFIAFTGDMTHTTNDAKERRGRMAEVRDQLRDLKTQNIRFVPGDHDATPDHGEAYQEYFGKLNYAFDHKGYHFVVIDNVSDREFRIGDAQLEWLASDLAQLPKEAPVVVLTHRPIFELYRPWGWFTPDGDAAMELLRPFKASVFYGHIHHDHHTQANGLMHHAVTALMIPLYPAATRPERMPRRWDADAPYAGMGWRTISARGHGAAWDMQERPVMQRAYLTGTAP